MDKQRTFHEKWTTIRRGGKAVYMKKRTAALAAVLLAVFLSLDDPLEFSGYGEAAFVIGWTGIVAIGMSGLIWNSRGKTSERKYASINLSGK